MKWLYDRLYRHIRSVYSELSEFFKHTYNIHIDTVNIMNRGSVRSFKTPIN